MQFAKEHYLRVTYCIMIAIVSYIAAINQEEITKNQESLNNISYWGTIATIVGLIIAILEVLHSIRVTKGIQAQAQIILLQSKKLDSASFISESLSALDETNHHVSTEDYSLSLKCFQYFRKCYARIHDKREFNSDIGQLIKSTELSLQKATHTSVAAPLNKRAKTTIQKDILDIKTQLEESNLSRSTEHVPS